MSDEEVKKGQERTIKLGDNPKLTPKYNPLYADDIFFVCFGNQQMPKSLSEFSSRLQMFPSLLKRYN